MSRVGTRHRRGGSVMAPWRQRLASFLDLSLLGVAVTLMVGVVGIGWGWYLHSTHDVVIAGGRVIDPESGTEVVRNIGIDNGRITAISELPMNGRLEIPAKGCIVGPGFIDVDSSVRRKYDQEMALKMGVTTVIDGEVGLVGSQVKGLGRLFVHVALGINESEFRNGQSLASGNITAWITDVSKRLDQGYPVIVWTAPNDGREFGLQLYPLIDLAQRYHAILSIKLPPMTGPADDSKWHQLIELSQGNQSILLVQQLFVHSHIWSHEVLRALGTPSNAPRLYYSFAPYNGRLMRPSDPSYSWIRLPGVRLVSYDTGEPLRLASSRQARWTGSVIAMLTPNSIVEQAMTDSHSFVGSETNWAAEPRPQFTGTFARVPKRWVIDTGKWQWVTVFQKLSYHPAQELSAAIPGLKNKGVLRVGADADLLVIDPKRLDDWATYQHPNQASRGIRHVFVSGQWVVRDGTFNSKVSPGTLLRSNQP